MRRDGSSSGASIPFGGLVGGALGFGDRPPRDDGARARSAVCSPSSRSCSHRCARSGRCPSSRISRRRSPRRAAHPHSTATQDPAARAAARAPMPPRPTPRLRSRARQGVLELFARLRSSRSAATDATARPSSSSSRRGSPPAASSSSARLTVARTSSSSSSIPWPASQARPSNRRRPGPASSSSSSSRMRRAYVGLRDEGQILRRCADHRRLEERACAVGIDRRSRRPTRRTARSAPARASAALRTERGLSAIRSGTCAGSSRTPTRREREVVPEERRPVLSAPARMIADVVGFGTVLSPRANWRMTDFAGRPPADRRGGAVRTRPGCRPASPTPCCRSPSGSPRAGDVSISGGRFRSGMFSLNWTEQAARAPACGRQG